LVSLTWVCVPCLPVSVTVTPGRTAPCSSLIVPVIDPVKVCARAGAATIAASSSAAAVLNTLFMSAILLLLSNRRPYRLAVMIDGPAGEAPACAHQCERDLAFRALEERGRLGLRGRGLVVLRGPGRGEEQLVARGGEAGQFRSRLGCGGSFRRTRCRGGA